MFSRRQFLQSTSCGFGALAFAGLSAQQSFAGTNNLLPKEPHHKPKAKRVIFIFMQGGVSQVDSFDYKPRLVQDDGKMMPFDDSRILANTGKKATPQRVMKSLWKHKQYGQTGHWGSELFPHLNQKVDDLTFIHSMHTEGVAHGPATLFLHCGAANFIRPSMGAWMLYGLGTENQSLPGFVSIMPSPGNGGARNYGTAFLPAMYQGTALGKAGGSIDDVSVKNLKSPLSQGDAAKRMELIQAINQQQMQANPADSAFEAVAESYELAWRMQANAPEVFDISKETPETLKLYGIGEKHTDTFGRQCLLARRLAEQNVRYIQVTYGDGTANPAWDQHSNLPKHADHALATDKPVAGLLEDLKRRGLLEDTLIWWGSEFGRTPYAEKNGTGRDHNINGFTMWLAGAGVKPGYSHGKTDDFGFWAVENKVHMHDMHATIMHLMGLDHEKLTYTYAGRPFRLTDVHGHVVKEILA